MRRHSEERSDEKSLLPFESENERFLAPLGMTTFSVAHSLTGSFTGRNGTRSDELIRLSLEGVGE